MYNPINFRPVTQVLLHFMSYNFLFIIFKAIYLNLISFYFFKYILQKNTLF